MNRYDLKDLIPIADFDTLGTIRDQIERKYPNERLAAEEVYAYIRRTYSEVAETFFRKLDDCAGTFKSVPTNKDEQAIFFEKNELKMLNLMIEYYGIERGTQGFDKLMSNVESEDPAPSSSKVLTF